MGGTAEGHGLHAQFLIARSEIRTRWASLLLIGLLTAVTGAVVVSAGTLARRTATADERLSRATRADDVRSLVIGGSAEVTGAIGREVVALPEVERGRVAIGGVARVDAPGIVYQGFMIAPERWGQDVLSPVLSAGRLPRPDRADEIVVNEEAIANGPVAVGLGSRLTFHLLTADEFAAFDAATPLTGRAGDQRVTVVGVVRWPGGPEDLPAYIGTAALAAAHPRGVGVLGAALVQLAPGADLARFTDRVNRAGRTVTRVGALADYPPTNVISTAAQSDAAIGTTTRVLTTGLLALGAVTALVGLVAVGQASARHHATTAAAQQIESAIGVTALERTQARVLAAVPAAGLATALTAVAGLAGGHLAPPGALRTVEPHPGWSPNLALTAVTSIAIGLALLGIVVLTSGRAQRRHDDRPLDESPLVARTARLGGRPATVLGLRFALEPPPGRSGAGARTGMATIAIGMTGVLAAMVFGANLHRLVHTPLRYGYPVDIVIADAGPALARDLTHDGRFAVVVAGRSADILIDGHAATGTSQRALAGRVRWELADGRPPASPEEVVLGTRLSIELGKGVGDVVDLRDGGGARHRLAVVGVGVVPNYGGGGLGRSAGLTDDGLGRVASASPFGEVGLTLRPGLDVTQVADQLRTRYEVQVATLPRDVANLEQIDRVPLLLGAVLAALCAGTLVHAVATTTRRRRDDLATVRALGFTPRQSATSIAVMAATTALVGVAVAYPLGLALGTTVWRRVAEGAAVVADVSHPWPRLVAVTPVALALALVATAVARRTTPRRPVAAPVDRP